MGKFDWKKVVGTVAPTIATALGGPLAGAAVAAVGKAVLGKDNATEGEIEAAMVNASPADLLKLKEADNAFKLEMEKLGVDLERVHAGDRDSARKREMAVQDWTPRILAYMVISGFLGIAYTVLFADAKPDSVLAGTIIGYVSAKADQALSYYFGSTKGSAEKTRLLAQADSVK